jgi:hypothetical protein
MAHLFFKTSEKKILIYPHNISEEIFCQGYKQAVAQVNPGFS